MAKITKFDLEETIKLSSAKGLAYVSVVEKGKKYKVFRGDATVKQFGDLDEKIRRNKSVNISEEKDQYGRTKYLLITNK